MNSVDPAGPAAANMLEWMRKHLSIKDKKTGQERRLVPSEMQSAIARMIFQTEGNGGKMTETTGNECGCEPEPYRYENGFFTDVDDVAYVRDVQRRWGRIYLDNACKYLKALQDAQNIEGHAELREVATTRMRKLLAEQLEKLALLEKEAPRKIAELEMESLKPENLKNG